MLGANLSTRPFYNERLVRVVLGLITLMAVGLTAYNAARILALRSEGAEARGQADTATREAGQLRADALRIRQTINREQLAAVQAAAHEANQLIDRRTFSWTELFNQFERTLPAGARIAAVTPQFDTQGRMMVAVSVVSRRVEDLDAFIDALEKTGAFRQVLSRQEEAQEDGTLMSVIQGYYRPSAATPAPAEAAVDRLPPPAAPATTEARAEVPR